eukprot:575918-Prymnesium_polylepis.1
MPEPCSVGSRVCSGMRMDYLQKGYVDAFRSGSTNTSQKRTNFVDFAKRPRIPQAASNKQTNNPPRGHVATPRTQTHETDARETEGQPQTQTVRGE